MPRFKMRYLIQLEYRHYSPVIHGENSQDTSDSEEKSPSDFFSVLHKTKTCEPDHLSALLDFWL